MSRKGSSSYALLLGVLILSLATGVLYAAATASNLDWWFLGGSGGRSTSGGHVLEGTLGQPVVGLATSGDNSLCAGFWCGAQGEYSLYLPVIVSEATWGQHSINLPGQRYPGNGNYVFILGISGHKLYDGIVALVIVP